ncbi:hypothetical protein FQA39_LY19098 [Lamprigera yunnana]|nr:hypothetical protein FQA39_LY19098 [Lamprigera yunnana]
MGNQYAGPPYAADRRRGYRQWYYPRRGVEVLAEEELVVHQEKNLLVMKKKERSHLKGRRNFRGGRGGGRRPRSPDGQGQGEQSGDEGSRGPQRPRYRRRGAPRRTWDSVSESGKFQASGEKVNFLNKRSDENKCNEDVCADQLSTGETLVMTASNDSSASC